MNYSEIFNWIDKEMKFDLRYKVKSEAQREVIKEVMRSGLIPDCEFNSDYSKFRKSKTAYEIFFIKPETKTK